MGVQVGNQCFSNLSEAENYLFSQVTPVPAESGLLMPSYDGVSGWIYNGVQIHANLPECSQIANFAQGSAIGWALVGLMATAWGFRIIQRVM